jgi:hypothetical protein|tara:strand:- start:275 stop:436 length:162 start_codon:yes stop_codon:yes gene_type:complete
MIRWYDWIAAVALAQFILVNFFTIPIIGAIIAYVAYTNGWDYYCQYRLRQENK